MGPEVEDIEEKVRKKIVIRWWHCALAIIFLFLTADQMMTNYLNNRFKGAVEYNGERGLYCEDYPDYYIMAGTAKFLIYSPLSSVVALKDVYYNNEHKTVTVSLTIYMDKLGRVDYLLGFRDYNEETHVHDDSFAGYAFVDSHMNYMYDDVRNDLDSEYICELMAGCEVYIERLAEIANERWNLGITMD